MPSVIGSIPVDDGPEGVAVSPDDTRTYVAHIAVDGTVSVIRNATNKVVKTIAVGRSPGRLAVSPDNSRVYVPKGDNASGPDGAAVIDTATDTVLTTVVLESQPIGVAVSPVYASNGPTSVSVIDTASNTVTATEEVANKPHQLAVSPDGSRVYVTNVGTKILSEGLPARRAVLS